MIAAGLWALDSLIRTQLTFSIPSTVIVFLEHTIGFIFLIPFFIRGIPAYKKLNVGDWLNILLMTIVSSVLGTVLFTQALNQSYAVFDFATPILLQKLQPLFVIILSAIFLREKISFKLIALIPFVMIGSYMISFGTDAVNLQPQGKEAIFLLAIGAALAWGSGTIFSKKVLQKLNFSEGTAIRFLMAIPISFIFTLLFRESFNYGGLQLDQILRFVLIALSTGAVALLIYYQGLKHTEAKIATIAELTFPIVSILIAITTLNPYGKPQQLSLANIFGIIILLLAIILICFDHYEKPLDKSKS
jgi:drug/metabolite transporter (DMT)-like permease